jgi:hypothetical protein
MTGVADRTGKVLPVARIRLEKKQMPVAVAPERPPVFHVFEEMYARTMRDAETRSYASGLAAGHS